MCRFKMSRAVSHCNRPFWPSYIALLLFILILTSMTLQRVAASPLPNSLYANKSLDQSSKSSTKNSIESSTEASMNSSADSSMDSSMASLMNNSADSSMDSSMASLMNSSADSSMDNSSESASDVYVIKAVVYEIGILTDMDNTTSSESSENTERQERVDISLYNTPQEDQF